MNKIPDSSYNDLPLSDRINTIFASLDRHLTPMTAFIRGLEVATQAPAVAHTLLAHIRYLQGSKAINTIHSTDQMVAFLTEVTQTTPKE